ncbi:MAG: hypothetical protein EB127_07660 [Alphaproteobacteria bacterium]|nr:hypothetical protein [Alphaproteobacteria bacterium]
MSKSIFGFLKTAEVVSFCADGSVDWETTLSTIQNKVESEIAESAERDYVIEATLTELFNKLPEGGSLPRPIAVSLTVSKVLGNTDNLVAMADWTGHVNDYLDRTTKFIGKRGRNGGLFKV